MDENQFYAWERSSRQTIDFKMTYVDVAGDLMAGLLLSQIVYWFTPDRNGKSKLRVERDGRPWLAKKHSEWHDEIRMTEDQVRRALGLLKKEGLIEVQTFKFAGVPTTHISLNTKQLIKAIKEVESIPADTEGSTPSQMEMGSSPDGNGLQPKSTWDTTQMDLGLNPDLYTETTNRDYKQRLPTESKSPRKRERPTPKTDSLFDEFWSLYPKKMCKQEAIELWKKLTDDEKQLALADMKKGRGSLDSSWLDDDTNEPTFAPNPAKYLRRKRWEDEWTPIKTQSNAQQARSAPGPVETTETTLTYANGQWHENGAREQQTESEEDRKARELVAKAFSGEI